MLFNPRLLGALAALLPTIAGALGLGEAHVSSALNQPLNATIDVLAAGPSDLKDLTVTLAPRDVFERQGVERSAFLSNLTFKVTRAANGEAQVEVHSTQPATEPFLTFLVAIDWPRGHLVREYTLMLDPPVFEAKPSAPAAVVAPASGVTAAAAGAINRESSAPTAAASTGATEHTVVAGETLSSVIRAQGYSSATDVNRALIATFRANPAAFDGNINRLRRGAILRVPPQSEWSRLGIEEATAEVHRQVGDWKGAQREPHLRLVVPKTPVTEAPASGTAKADGQAAAKDQAAVAEMRRLLELKNAELARLQDQLAHKGTAPSAAVAAPPAAAPVPAQSEPVATPAEAPAPAPAAATPAPRKHSSTPVVPPAEPGLLEVVADNAPTLIGGVLAVLIVVLVAAKARSRRRQAEASDVADTPVMELGRGFPLDGDLTETHPRLSATPRAEADFRQRIEVSESGDEHEDFQPPPFNSLSTQAIPHSATPGSPPLDSRLGAESSITLHHMDPIAEADFHIAYGLYSQAADILRLAIEVDGSRADLKLKLLEVHFVAGDAAAFLSVARVLDKGAFEPAEWDRVLVMGRQLAPNDPLFAGRLEVSAGMDLDLGAGAAGTDLDFELADGDTVAPVAAEPSDSALADFHLDLEKDLLDLSATLDPSASHTLPPSVAAAAPAAANAETTSEIDLEDLDLPADLLDGLPEDPVMRTDTVLAPYLQEATQQISALPETDGDASVGETPQELLAEASRLLANLWPDSGTTSAPAAAPTPVSAPAPAPEPFIDPSQSATVAMPELPPVGSGPRSVDITLTDDWSDSEQETASVPVVKTTTASSASTETPLAGLKLDDLKLGDEPLEFDLDDLARALQDDTLAQPGPDRSKFTTDLLATGLHVQPPPVHAGDDLLALDDDVSRSRNNDLDLPDLDAVTLSEVGTKLDLARAYLDMGDPDGARAILEEVLSEGSPSQKIEAQRLVETLPG